MRNNRPSSIAEIVEELEDLSIRSNELIAELRRAQQQEDEAIEVNAQDSRGARDATPARQATVRGGATRNPGQGSPLFLRHTKPPVTTTEFKLGDRAIIANSYLGLKGTKGEITHITPNRITIRDDLGRLHARKPSNLRRLQNGE